MTDNLKEKIQKNLDNIISGGVETGAAVLGQAFSDALIGQVTPGIVTAYMSYKQKKTEKMIMTAISNISDRLNALEEKLSKLSSEDWIFIKESFLPVFLNAITDEQQEEKISLLVNGFQTVIEYQITDIDVIILYYDIMRELRILDLKTLMWFANKPGAEAYAETSISRDDVYQSSINHIAKKLEGLHLIWLQKLWGEIEGKEYTVNRERGNLTVLGERFIDFFSLKGGL